MAEIKDKDKLKKEKLEQLEIKQKEKERQQKKKEREKRLKKRYKKEVSKMNKTILTPYKVLFEVAIILLFISFGYLHIGNQQDLISALFTAFLVFAVVFIGGGFIIFNIYWLKSIEKEREMKQQLIMEEEKRNERNKNGEFQDMDEIEKEIEFLKNKEKEFNNKQVNGKNNLNNLENDDFDIGNDDFMVPDINK